MAYCITHNMIGPHHLVSTPINSPAMLLSVVGNMAENLVRNGSHESVL